MTKKYDRLERIDPAHLCCGCTEAAKRFERSDNCDDKIGYRLYLSNAPETHMLPDDDAYRKLFRRAFDIVESTCGTRFFEVLDDTAIVEIDFANTGSGVLAWSNVGFDCHGGVEQRYGSQWDWDINFLLSTILHEVGHLLGLDHDVCVNPDGESNIMCWQIQDDELIYYDKVTAGNLRDIYGGPFDVPNPPEPPQPPNPPRPPEEPPKDDWPYPFQYGEPLRNFFRFFANIIWYLTTLIK